MLYLAVVCQEVVVIESCSADRRLLVEAGFLAAAVAWYGQLGITIQRLLTDNGPLLQSQQLRPQLRPTRLETSPHPALHAAHQRPNASSRPPSTNEPTPAP